MLQESGVCAIVPREQNGFRPTVHGMGILVNDREIVTCAHVIDEALGQGWQESPTPAIVRVCFPLLEPCEWRDGSVDKERSLPDKDIAVIRLREGEKERAHPSVGCATFRKYVVDNKVRAYGFRGEETKGRWASHPFGEWADGIIVGPQPGGRAQFEGLRQTGARVEKGYSGAGVYDLEQNALVGMIVEKDRDSEKKIAQIIDANLLQKTLGVPPGQVTELIPPFHPAVIGYLKTQVETWSLSRSPLLPDDVFLADLVSRPKVQFSQLFTTPTQGALLHTEAQLNLTGPVTIQDIITSSTNKLRYILYGEPGSGKTTLFCKEVAVLSEDCLNNKNPVVPFFVRLSELTIFLKGTNRTVFDYIDMQVSQIGIEKISSYIKAIGYSGKAVFFLDGIDEVPPRERDLVHKSIQFIGQQLPGALIFVSGRIVGSGKLKDFTELSIMPLSVPDQRRIMLILCGEERTQRLLMEIGGRGPLRNLSQNPMILSIICIVINSMEEFSATYFRRNVDLYRQAVRLMLSSEYRQSEGVKNVEVAERSLSALSFLLHKRHEHEVAIDAFTGKEIESILNEIPDIRNIWGTSAQFLKDITEKSNIIFPTDPLGQNYRYIHRTFREYLAAKYISEQPLPSRNDLIQEVVDQPDWAETLVFAAGLLDDDGEYILTLLQNSREVALRALKEVKEVDPVLALKVLELPPASRAARRILFQRLQQRLGSSDFVVDTFWAYLKSMKDYLPRIDLYFMNEILARVGTVHSQELRQELFNFLPPIHLGLIEELGGAPTGLGYWCSVDGGYCVVGGDVNDPDRPDWAPGSAKVFISGFQIGRVPVTNLLYEYFDPWHRVEREFSGQVDDAELDYHPAVELSWYEAASFCLWAERAYPSMRLPTEWEWEKAASWSSSEQVKRRFPWGNDWNPEHLNSWEKGPNRTTRVGQYVSGKSPCGALDMLGNVWEWCIDKFGGDLKFLAPMEGSFPVDPIQIERGDRRVDGAAVGIMMLVELQLSFEQLIRQVISFRIVVLGFCGKVQNMSMGKTDS